MKKTLLRPALLTLAAFALSACAEVIIADRTVSINKAVEQANNRLLLLNAVRASERHPLYFAKITSVSVADPLQGAIGLTLPFGRNNRNAFSLAPGISAVKSGLTYTYQPLDDPKFIAAVNKQVSLATFRRLLQQGWPEGLIFHVLVRKISLKRESLKDINDAYQDECKKPKDEGLCMEIDNSKVFHAGIRDDLKLWPDCQERFEPFFKETSKKILKFENTPDDIVNDKTKGDIVRPCRFLAFQELVRRIRIAKFDFKEIPDENLNNTPDNYFEIVEKLTIKKTGSPTEVREKSTRKDEPKLDLRIPASETNQTSLTVADSGNSLVLRSPEDMIFYLGQLVRTHTAFKPSFIPKVAFGLKREKKDIFEVTLGAKDDAPVEVSFLDKTYHIPAGSRRSMHTLSLVNQMILLQQSEKAPPGPQDVRVINP